MKKLGTIVVLWLVFLLVLLSGCTTTSPTCLTSEKTRFQYNYNNPHTTPNCIGKECWRYQNR